MQPEQNHQATRSLPVHTKARLPADQAPKTQRVGKKLQVALKAIVWEGQDIAPAAKAAGMTGNAVRIALARPHVQRFLKHQRQVFIDHARAQNIHHAVRLRTSGNAMAELGAVKVIEQIGNEPQAQASRATSPGIVIIVGREKSVNLQAKPLELQVEALPCKGDAVIDGTERAVIGRD